MTASGSNARLPQTCVPVRNCEVRPPVTDAELSGLLQECLLLWGIQARVTPDETGMRIVAAEGEFVLQPAPVATRPIRWLLQTPVRAAAGRPPRAAPSIGAALAALRQALGGAAGSAVRIGLGA